MIRVVLFLLLVAILALAGAWLADRPGGVEIVWLNHRISTSVAVLAAAIIFIVVAALFAWWLVQGTLRSPARMAAYLRMRRLAKGERAITRGLIAVGAGDVAAAARHADEARRFVGDAPLSLLLSAQAAQLSGDRAAAERTLTAMAGRRDTKLLGLHGLFIEARRRGDAVSARALAEEAVRTAPSIDWAGRAVLEFRCVHGDWAGAIEALDANVGSGFVDKAAHRRQRAVLLTAQAKDTVEQDRDRARTLVLEAVKLAPELVPAAAMAGKFLADAGDARRAARIVETAWRANPHPDLAEVYMNLRPGDSARERLLRVEKLARTSPGSVESALAVARAAIDAQAFGVAREALKPLVLAPTQRVATLMAELDEAETGDIGRARQWMARAVYAARDPVWAAESFVSETWQAVSPSGRLDAFEWKVPVAELPGAVIEAAPAEPKAVAPPAPAAENNDARAEPQPASRPAAPATAPAAAPQIVDTMIPLVHAPDDPGPPFEPADGAAAGQKRTSWRRLRSLFG